MPLFAFWLGALIYARVTSLHWLFPRSACDTGTSMLTLHLSLGGKPGHCVVSSGQMLVGASALVVWQLWLHRLHHRLRCFVEWGFFIDVPVRICQTFF